MRAFGFRPAVEPGVLKREWRGLAVRVGDHGITAARPGRGRPRLPPGDADAWSMTASRSRATRSACRWSRASWT